MGRHPGEPNQTCSDCGEMFHTRPSTPLKRCPACRRGKQGQRAAAFTEDTSEVNIAVNPCANPHPNWTFYSEREDPDVYYGQYGTMAVGTYSDTYVHPCGDETDDDEECLCPKCESYRRLADDT